MAPSTKNSVILGEALASEEVNLVFPTEDFSRQAHVSSIQKVPFLHLFPPLYWSESRLCEFWVDDSINIWILKSLLNLPQLVHFTCFLIFRDWHIIILWQYGEKYGRSVEDPAGFWSDIVSEFYWKQKWGQPVYTENLDIRKGKINIEVCDYSTF